MSLYDRLVPAEALRWGCLTKRMARSEVRHPAACQACAVPEDHPLLESLSKAYGREFTHHEAQLMLTQLCAAHGEHSPSFADFPQPRRPWLPWRKRR